MSRRKKNQQLGPRVSTQRCSEIPDIQMWPKGGLAGKISQGELAGKWVLAFRDLESDTPAYILWLPAPEVFTASGDEYLMSGVVDDFWYSGGSGGLIDVVTRELRVVWSTSDEDLIDASAWYEEQSRETRAANPDLDSLLKWSEANADRARQNL